MSRKSKAGQILHIFVILSFLIGPLLWAILLYWAGENSWGHVSVGIFIIYSTLYWFYGVDYFKVDWLMDIKYGRKNPDSTSA